MALPQPTGQGLRHVAVPGQRGNIGPEGHDPGLDYPPAPADGDSAKPGYVQELQRYHH